MRSSSSGMMSLALLGLILALGTSSATLAADAAPAADPAHEVVILSYKFGPDVLTVPAGTTVTWINRDEVPHTVASSDKRFTSSPALDTGDHYSYTFTTPGTYTYFCTLHPFMVGKVIVEAPKASTPTATPGAR
ncbi:MAG TPA: cupredoxin family copper-binding protein [Gammaproteobacteria bacterium]|nr:cupredoxin family copper-binding protein [Gammaproteobacteria bacterium]